VGGGGGHSNDLCLYEDDGPSEANQEPDQKWRTFEVKDSLTSQVGKVPASAGREPLLGVRLESSIRTSYAAGLRLRTKEGEPGV